MLFIFKRCYLSSQYFLKYEQAINMSYFEAIHLSLTRSFFFFFFFLFFWRMIDAFLSIFHVSSISLTVWQKKKNKKKKKNQIKRISSLSNCVCEKKLCVGKGSCNFQWGPKTMRPHLYDQIKHNITRLKRQSCKILI